MVLRRQYRQLREELAKLPIPHGHGLEDLDVPFSATVQGAAAAAGSSSSGGGSTVATTTTTSASDLPATPSTISDQAEAAEGDFINISALNSVDGNMNDMGNHGLG